MKKITFILNPISGTISKAGVPELIDNTIDKDIYDYEIVFTERAGHATEIAAAEVAKGTDIVVALDVFLAGVDLHLCALRGICKI